MWKIHLVLNIEVPMVSNKWEKFCHPKYISIKLYLISSDIHFNLTFIPSQIFYYACFGGLSAILLSMGCLIWYWNSVMAVCNASMFFLIYYSSFSGLNGFCTPHYDIAPKAMRGWNSTCTAHPLQSCHLLKYLPESHVCKKANK